MGMKSVGVSFDTTNSGFSGRFESCCGVAGTSRQFLMINGLTKVSLTGGLAVGRKKMLERATFSTVRPSRRDSNASRETTAQEVPQFPWYVYRTDVV